MRKFLLTAILLSGVCVAASAQTGSAPAKGSNPNPDAPVNVSAPGLRPAQPATHSSTTIPEAQRGQFYVKDDKPATPDGRIITPSATPQVSKSEMMKSRSAAAPASPATKSSSAGKKPAAGKSSK